MKLLFLIGSPAVGKMTVGQELMRITNLRLFHNHMTIEPVIEVFGSYQGKTVDRIRNVIFEEFAKSSLEGMIFTYVWAFDQPSDWDYIERVKSYFQQEDTTFYYVELISSQATRLVRNKTSHRLQQKPSKRDIDFSESLLLQNDEHYRCVSHENEIPFDNYLRIDNTDLSATEVAYMIQRHFGW